MWRGPCSKALVNHPSLSVSCPEILSPGKRRMCGSPGVRKLLALHSQAWLAGHHPALYCVLLNSGLTSRGLEFPCSAASQSPSTLSRGFSQVAAILATSHSTLE